MSAQMNESIPCPYCGGIGHHRWAGAGACPGLTNPDPPIVPTGSTAFALEITVLKALCGRAADALEIAISHYGSEYEQRLISELRKAAE
jgi:hypothetical protein